MKKTISKEKMRRQILLGIQNSYNKNSFNEYELDRVDELLEEIYDTSINVIIPLDEEKTYLIRKRLGIYDDYKIQTYKDMSISINMSVEGVRQIIIKIFKELYIHRIKRSLPTSNKTRMSSFNLYDESLDFHISKLGLDTKINNILYKNRVNTISDLLSYGTHELENMGFGEISINHMYDLIHKLGLSLIEDLSIEERRIIVSRTSNKVIDNSSLYWIKGLDIRLINYAIKNNLSTIKDLRDRLNVDTKVIELAKEIGIDLSKKKINEKTAKVMYIDNLLDASVTDLDISTGSINCLRRANINTLRELIILNRADLINIRSLGVVKREEIVDFVHSLGLVFSDEYKTFKNYTDVLVEETSKQEDSRIELLNRYKLLLKEKARLKNNSSELDYEIKRVLRRLNNGMNHSKSR